MPAAAKGDRENPLFQQILRKGNIEVGSQWVEALRLVPIKDAASIIIAPKVSVVVQRQLISKLPDRLAVVLLHQVQGHRIGQWDIQVNRIAINVPAHHPPRELDGLAEGVFELVA